MTEAMTIRKLYEGWCLTGVQDITEQGKEEDYELFKQDLKALIKSEMEKMLPKQAGGYRASRDGVEFAFNNGWNGCRAELLQRINKYGVGR